MVDAVLTIATPLLLKRLIDDAVIPKNGALVTQLALMVGLIAILSAIFNIVIRWWSAQIGEGLIYDLRSQVFEHVQSQSIAFFTRTQTGALITRINSDVIGAQRAFTATFSGVISNAITLVLLLITMISLSWQITVLSLLLLPVFLAPTRRSRARSRRASPPGRSPTTRRRSTSSSPRAASTSAAGPSPSTAATTATSATTGRPSSTP